MKKLTAVLSLLFSLGSNVHAAPPATPSPALVWQAGPVGRPESLRFSPDGHLAVSVIEGKVKIWNGHSGEVIRTWDQAPFYVSDAIFSPDGHSLVMANPNKTISIWDIGSGALQQTLALPEACGSLAFTPDGKKLLAASGGAGILRGQVFVLDWGKRQLLQTLTSKVTNLGLLNYQPASQSMGITRDGVRVWLRTAENFTWWNIKTGRKERETTFDRNNMSDFLVPSPDGKYLARFNASSAQLEMLTPDAIQTLWSAKIDVSSYVNIRNFAFNPDGKWLLVSLFDSATIALSTSNGKRSPALDKAFEKIGPNQIASFSPDGKQLAIGAVEFGLLHFTPWPALSPVTEQPEWPNSIVNYGLSRDGRTLVWLQDDQVLVTWDLVRGQRTHMWQLEKLYVQLFFTDMSLSPDGQTAYLLSRHEVRAVNLRTGETLWSRFCDTTPLLDPATKYDGPPSEFISLSLSKDGKTLVTLQHDGPLLCWEATTGRWLIPRPGVKTFQSHFQDSALVSPHGDQIFIGGREGESGSTGIPLRAIDVANQSLVREFTNSTGQPIAISPDGKSLLVLDGFHKVGLYDTKTLKRRGLLFTSFTADFISNDRFICSNENGTFEERDVASGRLLKTWPTTQSHQGLRHFKMLSPNLLAAVPRDASLALWNINSQRQLATLAIPALPDLISPHWLAYTPQGFYTGSPGVEK
ncbi:WD40 repeat domain-containing protein, partial [bacterium]